MPYLYDVRSRSTSSPPVLLSAETLSTFPPRMVRSLSCSNVLSRVAQIPMQHPTVASLPQLYPRQHGTDLCAALQAWNVPDAIKDQAIQRFEAYERGHSSLLDLSGLALSSLPDVLPHLKPKLERISLANNQFTEPPVQLKSMRHHLKHVDLSANQLETLGDTFKDFQQLSFLDVSGNKLIKIPAYLADIKSLGSLNMMNNPINIRHMPIKVYARPQVQLDESIVEPMIFKFYSDDFAHAWPNFKKEKGAEDFRHWLFRLNDALLNAQGVGLKYFSKRLTCLISEMAMRPDLRKRCFAVAQESLADCEDRVLFSMFDMECKRVEEEIMQTSLSKDCIHAQMTSLFHFYRLQEKALQYLNDLHHQQSNPQEEERESLETVLSFLASPYNHLSMPIDPHQIAMFYPQVSKANKQAIRQALTEIQAETQDPHTLLQFMQVQPFWREFLYMAHKVEMDTALMPFDDKLTDLDVQKISEYDYMSRVEQIAADRKLAESVLYAQLTRQFFA